VGRADNLANFMRCLQNPEDLISCSPKGPDQASTGIVVTCLHVCVCGVCVCVWVGGVGGCGWCVGWGGGG